MKFLLNFGSKFSFIFVIIISCSIVFLAGPKKNLNESLNKNSNQTQEQPKSNSKSNFHLSQRGRFWVATNYAVAETATNFKDLESITLTTHCDPSFLAHVTSLVERWRGPISVAVYTPGSDFDVAIERIHFLRECSNSRSKDLIRKFVSFHLFFDSDPNYIPKNVHKIFERGPKSSFSCSKESNSFVVELNENRSNFSDDHSQISKSQSWSYRHEKQLTYPINVARNIAREMSSTFLVLPLDIELYPSVDFIPNFLKMLRKNPQFSQEMKNPRVGFFPPRLFVLPVFELLPSVPVEKMPRDKRQLAELFEKGEANHFQINYCPHCFSFYGQDEWVKRGQGQGHKVITVFDIAQRTGKYRRWEPFYVGTKNDPGFEERLSWEGQQDKHVQGFALCLLNATYHILDGAFLVHFPGIRIRTGKRNIRREEQDKLIQDKVLPELRRLYGDRADCSL